MGQIGRFMNMMNIFQPAGTGLLLGKRCKQASQHCF